MENRDYTVPPRERSGVGKWVIGGLVALALVIGISFMADDDNDHVNDISPAAGSSTLDKDSSTPSTPGYNR
jgi:hypothetical protein